MNTKPHTHKHTHNAVKKNVKNVLVQEEKEIYKLKN